MANQIRIKRRAAGGGAGAPASLLNSELAYNEDSSILYIGTGDNGSGVATSVIALAGPGTGMTLEGDQTIQGVKTFSGTLDVTGTFQLGGADVTATAAELNHLSGVTGNVQTQIDEVAADVSNLQTGTGLADGAANYGTATAAGFSGNTVSDDATVKQALIDIETALEGANSDAVDLRTLSGTADGETSYGTAFTGSTISDSATTKSALQDLETELEKAEGILGTSVGDTDLGTFGGTASILTDGGTVKAALEELEAAIADGSGTTTGDSGTASYSSGNINILGGTGLTSTGDNASTLSIALDDTAVTAAAYGAAASVGTFTVDQQGRLTAAADVAIAITHDAVTDFDAGVQENTLDSLAQPVANVALNSQRITGLADPQDDQDAATKAYCDATKQGLDVKDSVRVATTANLPSLSGLLTVDGVVLSAGDRVLVKDQTAGADNGLYEVASGSWTRTIDADEDAKVTSGLFVFVEEGTVNADCGMTLTTDGAITVGSTALNFTQFSGAGQITAGTGLSKTSNTINVGTADATRIVLNANDIDLATHGTAGTYNGLTVDAYGRVSSFVQPTTLAEYAITDAQPLDATLTALAGLTTSADELVYATGADAFAMTSLSAYGRSLIDDADAATARTTLGLGTMAIQDNTNVDIDGGTIDGVILDGGSF